MVNVPAVFAFMDRALDERGYRLEDEHYAAEAFGHRSRTYRKDPKTALALLWDARDYWFIVRGGSPWRDLAIYRDVRAGAESAEAIVRTLLKDVDTAI